MLWLLTALLLGSALFLPLTLTVDVVHAGQLRTRLTLRFLFFRRIWHFEGLAGVTAPMRRNPDGHMRAAWRHAIGARRYLRRHSEFVRLDALLLLHTGDAARTALYTGILRSAAALFPHPKRRICIQPDFFRPHSSLQARCIIRWKLGTLLLTAWLLLMETLLRQRLTESEAT